MHIHIAVTFSGVLRVNVGSARIDLAVNGSGEDEDARPTLTDALAALYIRYPQTRRYLPHDASSGARAIPFASSSVRGLLNNMRLDDAVSPEEVLLRDDDRLALLMPVIGG